MSSTGTPLLLITETRIIRTITGTVALPIALFTLLNVYDILRMTYDI
jgi:hypothetical protein